MSLLAVSALALLASLLTTGWFVRASAGGVTMWADDDFSGPQKFHEHAVPRVGGIGIALGLYAAAAALWFVDAARWGAPAAMLALCGLPALLAGLVEDLTKSVSPAMRLAAAALSALLVALISGVTITRTDIPGLDWLVGFGVGATAITVFAVAGVANSINLIDGFNGLASVCVALMLAGLAAVAWRVGDTMVVGLALPAIAAILGFLVWNYPRGLIFLGDGGAYFIGFYLAELALLLLARNPQVSPLFALLLVMYPVFETVFSMYRRRILKRRPVGQPDGAHLHSLVFRRVMRSGFANLGREQRVRRNSMTSPPLWALALTSVVPAVLFWDNSRALACFGVAFGTLYLWVYWRIVRFRAPRWLPYVTPGHRPRHPA